MATLQLQHTNWELPHGTPVETRAGQLLVRDSATSTGDDRPVVLLVHGWCADSVSNWATTFGPLAHHRRVIAVDLPGHGGSHLHGPFRLETAAESLWDVLDHLDIEHVTLVGYSMGGPITQLAGRAHPERVTGLVQAATAAHIVPSSINRIGLHLGNFTTGLSLEAGRLIRVARASKAEHTEQDRTLAGHVRWLMRASSKQALRQAGAELARYDSRAWIGQLAGLDNTVIVTARDRLVVPAAQRELAGRLGARNVEIGGGHDACLTAEFGATLVTTLTEPDQA